MQHQEKKRLTSDHQIHPGLESSAKINSFHTFSNAALHVWQGLFGEEIVKVKNVGLQRLLDYVLKAPMSKSKLQSLF